MPALDELGWLQFERLCELVMEADAGVDPAVWEGSADGQRRTVWDARLPLGERTLEPPVLIRCEWLRDGDTARLEALGDPEKLCLWQPARPRSVVTFVNHGQVGPLPVDHVVYGEAELLDAVRRLPDLRLRLPSVLSLEAAAPDPGALSRSTADVEAMRTLARVFVPTPAWQQAVSVLQQHNFLVLTGPPEMGKTAIARMLGLALLSQGWEVHECTRPDAGLRAARSVAGRSCSSPTTRSGRPSTGPMPPSAGRPSWTASCARPTRRIGSCGPRGRHRCGPGCGGCTASAAPSASRSRAPCRSTRPRSGRRRRR